MIIATTVDGGFQAHCLVGVYPPSSEAVDLGLSVKWAACNIGALHPEQYGCYFAWGETEPKLCYDWKTYIFGADSKGPFSKYVLNPSYGIVDERSVLDPEDDAATVYLGEGWRMPTEAEWTELKNNCTWEWTSDYNGTGVEGLYQPVYLPSRRRLPERRGPLRCGFLRLLLVFIPLYGQPVRRVGRLFRFRRCPQERQSPLLWVLCPSRHRIKDGKALWGQPSS